MPSFRTGQYQILEPGSPHIGTLRIAQIGSDSGVLSITLAKTLRAPQWNDLTTADGSMVTLMNEERCRIDCTWIWLVEE
jgi:hypothetical protein